MFAEVSRPLDVLGLLLISSPSNVALRWGGGCRVGRRLGAQMALGGRVPAIGKLAFLLSLLLGTKL